MRIIIAIVVTGFATFLCLYSATFDRPLSVELDDAAWKVSDWSAIRRGQASLIHAANGDEFRIYFLTTSSRTAGDNNFRSLPPSYSGNYCLVSSFDWSSQNNLGGYFSSFHSSPSAADTTIRRWEDGRRALTLDFVGAGSGFSGMWVHLFDSKKPLDERIYLDTSPFKSLAFWVRGGQGNERILLKASDAAWERKEDALAVGEVAEFLPERKLTDHWQPAVIPLKSLPAEINRHELAGLVFEVIGPGQGQIAIKDLAFCVDSQPPPLSPPLALPPVANPHENAMWVWNTRDILTSPEQQKELAVFSRKAAINRLYLQLPNEDQNLGATGEILLETDKWKPFLELLNTNGIYAYALDGFKNYALPAWHERVLLTVANVIRFNRSVEPRHRFRGIHCDIEPYLLEGFLGPQQQRLLQGYLHLLEGIAVKTRPAGLTFGVDIPFWYDAPNEITGKPLIMEFGGQRKLPSEHVIDIVDEVSVMDYRTSAFGADGIIAHAQGELACAARRGKQVFIGLETTELPDEDLLDFEGVPFRGMPDKPPPARCILVAPGPQTTMAFLVSGAQWNGARGQLEESNRNSQSIFWWPVKKMTFVPSTKISFARLGPGLLNRVMAEAQEELRRHSSFAGFALHDYQGYRRLLRQAQ